MADATPADRIMDIGTAGNLLASLGDVSLDRINRGGIPRREAVLKTLKASIEAEDQAKIQASNLKGAKPKPGVGKDSGPFAKILPRESFGELDEVEVEQLQGVIRSAATPDKVVSSPLYREVAFTVTAVRAARVELMRRAHYEAATQEGEQGVKARRVLVDRATQDPDVFMRCEAIKMIARLLQNDSTLLYMSHLLPVLTDTSKYSSHMATQEVDKATDAVNTTRAQALATIAGSWTQTVVSHLVAVIELNRDDADPMIERYMGLLAKCVERTSCSVRTDTAAHNAADLHARDAVAAKVLPQLMAFLDSPVVEYRKAASVHLAGICGFLGMQQNKDILGRLQTMLAEERNLDVRSDCVKALERVDNILSADPKDKRHILARQNSLTGPLVELYKVAFASTASEVERKSYIDGLAFIARAGYETNEKTGVRPFLEAISSGLSVSSNMREYAAQALDALPLPARAR